MRALQLKEHPPCYQRRARERDPVAKGGGWVEVVWSLNMTKSAVKRIVTSGYILYEYLPDENTYKIVGVIDATFDGGIDLETGIAIEDMEAKKYIESGYIKIKVQEL